MYKTPSNCLAWLSSSSWKCVVAGALSSLAWGPFYIWWVLIFTWGALITKLYASKTLNEALTIGWMWSFGWHMTSVFWIGESLWVDPLRFAWFWPVCVAGIPGIFACYIGVMSGLLWWGKRHFWPSPQAFGLIWCVLYSGTEYLKGVLFTGFPWNLTAYIWSQTLCIAQSASFLSSYGLGLVTLTLLSWPARSFLACSTHRSWWQGTGYMTLGLAFLTSWCLVRLHRLPVRFHSQGAFRLVQPNFSQREKHDAKRISINWNILCKLSGEKTFFPITHIIWPETSVPFSLSFDHLESIPLLAWTHKYPSHLIAGALLHTEEESFNSIIQVTPEGTRKILYHKQHLVPFGEYLPFRAYLTRIFPLWILQVLTPGTRNMKESKKETSIIQALGTPPCIMKICYEIIFPISTSCPKAQWILNLTNDGWFGYTPGPFQHLASAQFRAIETGLPVLRAANTGISAVFDGMGRTLVTLPLQKRGYIDTLLPLPTPSYCVWHGYIYTGMLILMTFFVGGYSLWRKR
ncbi:apolipoprotein N-acyltransferase [Holospora curviuscula]|nr:apolipoprotein N-acyltransferase [Holospora curviuscula]